MQSFLDAFEYKPEQFTELHHIKDKLPKTEQDFLEVIKYYENSQFNEDLLRLIYAGVRYGDIGFIGALKTFYGEVPTFRLKELILNNDDFLFDITIVFPEYRDYLLEFALSNNIIAFMKCKAGIAKTISNRLYNSINLMSHRLIKDYEIEEVSETSKYVHNNFVTFIKRINDYQFNQFMDLLEDEGKYKNMFMEIREIEDPILYTENSKSRSSDRMDFVGINKPVSRTYSPISSTSKSSGFDNIEEQPWVSKETTPLSSRLASRSPTRSSLSEYTEDNPPMFSEDDLDDVLDDDLDDDSFSEIKSRRRNINRNSQSDEDDSGIYVTRSSNMNGTTSSNRSDSRSSSRSSIRLKPPMTLGSESSRRMKPPMTLGSESSRRLKPPMTLGSESSRRTDVYQDDLELDF